ncbi:DUF6882 domain-containing protein [Aquimarina hainanensis]|uniref:DUF6882 domain-containing protein n=1 Tax=Aquimarina hainanensis TaxID=1578017 RepID=A0ABW5N8K7_9FLAO
MGLKEKRAVEAFRTTHFETIKNEINKTAGFEISFDISWDTLCEDRFSHLYDDTFPKIYFLPLLNGLKEIASDAMGQQMLQTGLKKVTILNQDNKHNPTHAITFQGGVLTIDHSPVLNADKVEDRTERIVFLLENGLEEVIESSSVKEEKKAADEEKVLEELDIEVLYNQCVARSFEQQNIFADMVSDQSWDFNMGKGTVTFGTQEFSMQMLGTYSEKEKSWLWAWGNQQSGIPEVLLEAVHELRSVGSKYGVEDFVSPKIDTEEDPGHFYGAIASSLTGMSCYCPLKFKGLNVYVLIKSDEIEAKELKEPSLLAANFTKMLTAVACSHKHALYSYLEKKGYSMELTGNNIVATKEGDQLLGIFDLKGRLVKLTNNKVAV